jgi:hypothetical protein
MSIRLRNCIVDWRVVPTSDWAAALKALTNVQDAAKRKEIDQASNEAIAVLHDAASKAPKEAVEGVKEISIEADKTGLPM